MNDCCEDLQKQKERLIKYCQELIIEIEKLKAELIKYRGY